MNKKHPASLFVSDLLGITGMGVALFWSAGRMDWWQAWAAIGVWLVCFTAMDITLLRFNPELIAERLKPAGGSKAWDKAILSILRITQLIRYILAGLDQRFDWSGEFNTAIQIAAILVCLLGYGLFVWAVASNSFFSQVVRIQSDRGHIVATRGPYRILRHPGYAGMILFELAMSTLLGSWWAILAGGVCVCLLILRTSLEDHTLRSELTGYEDYACQVHYRLVPGIW